MPSPPEDHETPLSGHFRLTSSVGGEDVRAYVPSPLPQRLPVDLNALQARLGAANRAIGALDAISILLPSVDVFVYMYVRKEAVLSSQIEGTQSTLMDLLESEGRNGYPSTSDLTETSSYVKALERGTSRIRENWPLTGRLFDEIHSILLSEGRGSERTVGVYRRTQNWVGGSRPGTASYVPPPADDVAACMGELERFINQPSGSQSSLIRAGLAHAMFETIHPYEDGNGRLGRMLVPLLLMQEGALKNPLLYISLFLKENRDTYYERLQATRTATSWDEAIPAWTEWTDFFLEAVERASNSAVSTVQNLGSMFKADRERISTERSRPSAVLQVHEAFQQHPIRTVPDAAAVAKLTYPTAAKAIAEMEGLGIVEEITGKKRDRVFAYREYLRILNG